MVLTWSRGSDGAHRFSCDRKLLASSDTTSDIFRRFLSFRVFDSSFTSLLFSKQCQAAIARFLVAVLAGDRRELVFFLTSSPLLTLMVRKFSEWEHWDRRVLFEKFA